MTKQIKDDGGSTIALLGYRSGGATRLNYTTSSANTIVLASNAKVVTITPTTTCFVEFSSNSAPASTSSHYFVGGLPYDVVIRGEVISNCISVIGSIDAGTLYISVRS